MISGATNNSCTDCANINQTWTIAKEAGKCLWTSGDFTLCNVTSHWTFAPSGGKWVLAAFPNPVVVWQSVGGWDGVSPLVLNAVADTNCNIPSSITIYPVPYPNSGPCQPCPPVSPTSPASPSASLSSSSASPTVAFVPCCDGNTLPTTLFVTVTVPGTTPAQCPCVPFTTSMVWDPNSTIPNHSGDPNGAWVSGLVDISSCFSGPTFAQYGFYCSAALGDTPVIAIFVTGGATSTAYLTSTNAYSCSPLDWLQDTGGNYYCSVGNGSTHHVTQ